MFIETRGDGYINANSVTHFVVGKSPEGRPAVVRVTFWVPPHDEPFIGELRPEEIEKLTSETITAQPGFMRMSFYMEDGKEWTEREPVLAWRVYPGDHTEPICPETLGANALSTVVQYPDGKVVDIGMQVWDSEAAWLEDQRKSELAKPEVSRPTIVHEEFEPEFRTVDIVQEQRQPQTAKVRIVREERKPQTFRLETISDKQG